MAWLVHIARRLNRWLPALLVFYWLAIFTATHWPKLELPGGSVIFSSDKFLHFTAYMILGLLLTWTLAASAPWRQRGILGMLAHRRGMMAVVIVVIVAFYGIFDELTQPIAGRSTELLDWLADLAGVTTGIVLIAVIDKIARSVAPGGLVVPHRQSADNAAAEYRERAALAERT